MAEGKTGPKLDLEGVKLTGKLATVALTALTVRQGMHIDEVSDVFVVSGMTIADTAMGYLSFRDSFVGRFVGRKLNKKGVSNNRDTNTRLAWIALAFGGIMSGSIAADQHMSKPQADATAKPPTLTLPPRPTDVTVITNPPTNSAEETLPVTDYPCELEPFSPDGDGFPSSGSGDQIAKLQAGINVLAPQLNIPQIEVTGNLVDNTESRQAIATFKEWAAVQLGDSFVSGPDGEVTLQMCGMLDLWNDGDPNTP